MSELGSTLKLTADATGVEVGVATAKRSIASLGQSAAQAGQAGGDGLKKIGEGSEAAAKRVDAATKTMTSSLQRQIALLEAGDKSTRAYQETLARMRGVDVAVLKPYLDQLDEMKAKQLAANAAMSGANVSLESVGMSAKATAAAMRGVPAQFTDIITSLQGGQKPLTVLMQQGGQLKDMFGGAGNAAKALGTYVVGLVNPFTVAAAAAGALGFAYVQGAKEADGYRTALIETGNAAGTTALKLQASAAAVSKNQGVTQYQAAEALTAFAAGNNVASQSFEKFSGLAVRLKDVTGKAIGETVAQFQELGKSPVEASLKLNEATHFLTVSVYQQIKALAEQGKASQAAAVAQEAYFNVSTSRLALVEANLGYAERGWNALAAAAKGGWDAMMNIGRPTDPLTKANGYLEAAEGALSKARERAATSNLHGTEKAAEEERLRRLEGVVAARREEAGYAKEVDRLSQRFADRQKQESDFTNAQAAFDKTHAQYRSQEVLMEQEIKRARQEASSAPKTPENAKALKETEAGIRERYSGEGPKTALAAIIQGYEDQQAAVVAGEQRLAKTLAAQHAAQLLDDGAYYQQKRAAELQAIADSQKIVEQEKAAVKASGIKSSEKTAQLERYNGELQKLRQQALGIENDYWDNLVTLDAKERKTQDDYIAQLGKAGASESKRLQETIDKQIEHNAQIGLTQEQIEAYKRTVQDAATVELKAQADAIEAMLQKNAALVDYGDILGLIGPKAKEIYEEELKNLKEQVAERNRLSKLYAEGSQREAAVASAKAANAEWKRGWEETDRLGREVFTDWATDGSNAAQKIGDTLKKALLSAIYDATLKPIVLQIYTSVMGGGGASAVATSGNGAMGLINTANGARNLYSVGSQYFSGAMSGANAMGTLSANAAGTGMDGLLATNGAYGTAAGSGGAAAGAGSTAGFAGIPVIGWILAGMAASGSAYDAGFRGNSDAHGATNPINWGLNAEDRLIGQPLGLDGRTSAILSGSALGSWASYQVFGGHTITPNGTVLAGQFGSTGASALQQRVDSTEDHRGVLGMGSYTTHNSEFSGVDAGTTTYINETVRTATAGAKAWAAAVGLSTDAVDGFTEQLTIDITGLDPAKQKEAIDKAVGGFFNDMVTSAYSASLTPLAHSGETTAQTLMRVGTNLALVNSGLQTLGYASLAVSVDGAKAASGLVDAAGGLERLQSLAGYYYDHFYSDAEKAANGVAGLSRSFAALGYDTVPTTRAAFRTMIDQLDLTTESGRHAAVGLAALAPAFDTVANAALAAANKMLGALQDYGTSDEVRSFTVGMIQKGLADGGVNLSTDQIANASRADARALYESYAAQHTAAGDRAAEAILNQSKAFANITQPKPVQQPPAGGDTGGWNGAAVASAGAEAASSITNAWQQITDSIWGEVKRIRKMVEGTGEQAYAAAQARFAIATGQARAGDQEAAKALPELSQNLLVLAEANAQTLLQLRATQAQTAGSLAATTTLLSRQYGLTLPSFDVGTNRVPYDMAAMIHKDEQIIPAAFNPMLNGNGDAEGLSATALRRIADRLDLIEANTRAGAQHGGATSRLLTRLTPDGDALATREAT